MNFTAIDFETANSSRASACAVGLITVENGNITDEFYQLIRPEPLYFSPFNTSIHGITETDVKDAPIFLEIWPTILNKIKEPLVAHNASFDISVIRNELDKSNFFYPKLDYFCTRVIAKCVWPGQPTYALDYIAQLLNISFNHHNALDDARACALIAMQACHDRGISSLFGFEEPLVLSAGRLYPGGYSMCHGMGRDASVHKSRSPKLKASDITTSVEEFDSTHPFFGKTFVFTGAMTELLRKDAMQAVVDHGGSCHDTVKSDTNFLVLGQKGYIGYREGYKSSKMKKAESILDKGGAIEILSEADFISML